MDGYKPPLQHAELTDVIDLALWAGQLLLQHGAESARIEETVHHIGTGLGCDWMDVIVHSQGLYITAISGEEFRTKVRRVARLGVNFDIIDAVNHISRKVYDGKVDRFELRKQLEAISTMPHCYNRWAIALGVGVACAAFSRLFGGDLAVMFVTLFASSVAMIVRQELTNRYFNNFLIVVTTAAVAGIFASVAELLHMSDTPQIAMAAAVLLLVPGVPLINAAEDILHGNIGTGVARGVFGAVVTLGIALGLSIAIRITGVGL
ncbi:MAG: hypothetical protein CUN56_13930 [Phototrophicales bacterium]|nr:MAG: hypothetical protein CUN56_13930 [Phototrophicales bacterium]RMG70172.1 MAG: threonine/serine exporter [Chloroflexota bacterium]